MGRRIGNKTMKIEEQTGEEMRKSSGGGKQGYVNEGGGSGVEQKHYGGEGLEKKEKAQTKRVGDDWSENQENGG